MASATTARPTAATPAATAATAATPAASAATPAASVATPAASSAATIVLLPLGLRLMAVAAVEDDDCRDGYRRCHQAQHEQKPRHL
ncbi:hypothetical protein OPV22_006104 [Ensete ventricosum]|uniref:Uncharacterized protein n=1 Tax=Ensete ventricosum TaxID=4639 RepID=A0AAV8RI29_ENSVE|nr:hypothetical protein OPV22_006104 [Ensete ventricosum]